MAVNDAQFENNEYGLQQKNEQCGNILEEGVTSSKGQTENNIFDDMKIEIKEEAFVDSEVVRVLKNYDVSRDDIDEKSCVRSELTIKETRTDSCDIPSDILNNTELNNTEKEVDILEGCIDRNFNVLERSKECVENTYKKLLGTSEELRVSVKRENLHELQKLYKGEGSVQSKFQSPSYTVRRIRCKACPFVTKSKYDLLVHIVRTHEELAAEMEIPPLKHIIPGQKPGTVWYKCIDCAYVSKQKNHMQNHILTHKQLHEVETFRVIARAISTVYKVALRKHQILHSESKKLYKCNLCSFQTVHEGVLKYKHLLTHKERLFICANCPYKSKTKDTLRKHMLVHRRPETLIKYRCDKCTFQTIRKDGIRNHQQVHKAPEELILLPCSLCPYKVIVYNRVE
ncbi:hypothetical protein NQ314_003520 [Rhamnusium bicolor]|uniref:C2H2-type domain-containing protein n=1 Tax=Rhamnusium bicolor TaxID=1586634 RepID=A0AAV8ZMY9_9CUCU|nr:hypothetical protein NQ314_003520 [Rhamnusium bicolor]